MKRSMLVAALASLVLAGTALATTTYAGPQQWSAGQGAGSSYSSSWTGNYFFKNGSGHDSTVTFIDNVSYSWHATIRNTSDTTYTNWWVSNVKKGYCRANASYFWGSCAVTN